MKKVEENNQVRVLYAVESGSSAWGGASKDSDWDVRYIYVHKPEWYFHIEEQRDVIENMFESLHIKFMEKYNYINGIKVYDKIYDDNLHMALKTVWPKNEKGLVPKVRVLDDLDFLDCHPEMDRTDNLDCYVYINSDTIKLQDIIRFSKMIEVSQDAFDICCCEEEGIYLYWVETVNHPSHQEWVSQ